MLLDRTARASWWRRWVDAEKPDGFVVLSAEQARERFAASPPGLGARHRLKPPRGSSARESPPWPPRRDTRGCAGGLGRLPAGAYLGRLARFEDDREIETEHTAKSESRETTFDRDLRGVAELEPELRVLTEQLCATLAKHERRGRTIGIKVRYDDFSIVTRARSLAAPVNQLDTVWEVALDLLRRLEPPRPVRLIGVRVAGLDEAAAPVATDDQMTLAL